MRLTFRNIFALGALLLGAIPRRQFRECFGLILTFSAWQIDVQINRIAVCLANAIVNAYWTFWIRGHRGPIWAQIFIVNMARRSLARRDFLATQDPSISITQEALRKRGLSLDALDPGKTPSTPTQGPAKGNID